MRRFLAAATVAFILAGCASAPKARQAFSQADRDSDGGVDWEEYKVSFPREERNGFLAIDENRDGRLDLSEWEAGVGYRF